MDFLLPMALLRSLVALSSASNLSLSSPLPAMSASAGRNGDSLLPETGGGGGESKVGRKLSESSLRKEHWEKGEKGSVTGSSGDASEMEIAGTGERARRMADVEEDERMESEGG